MTQEDYKCGDCTNQIFSVSSYTEMTNTMEVP